MGRLKIEIEILEWYAGEGYSVSFVDTEKEDIEWLSQAIVDGYVEVITILDPSVKNVGKSLFNLIQKKEQEQERIRQKRINGAKKGWVTRRKKAKTK